MAENEKDIKLIVKKLHEKVDCQDKWEVPKCLVPEVAFKNTLGLSGGVLKLEKRIKMKTGVSLDEQRELQH